MADELKAITRRQKNMILYYADQDGQVVLTKDQVHALIYELGELEFANNEWKIADKLWKETVEHITKTADVIDERNQKLRTALIEQRKRMELGQKEGFESETIFWTRCIWEIDEVLGEVNKK